MKNFFLILLTVPLLIHAQTYSGGAGTLGDPYQIATTADLITLSKTSAHWSSYFIQTADITFNSNPQLVDWDGDGTATWDAEDQPGFLTISVHTPGFFGSYDGQNHTIANLYINRPTEDEIGLFSTGGSISNLGLINCNITGRDYVGALSGMMYIVENCYSTGIVSGRDCVGGLGGYIDCNTITNCYSRCNVNGTSNVGGLVGWGWCEFNKCYSTGNVAGEEYVGGLVGYLMALGFSIYNCYSLGDVTCTAAGTNVGAFCGYIEYSSIENSYCTGKVFYTNSSSHSNLGFVGSATGVTYINNYFDSEVSNQSSGLGATAKTTNEMKTQSTFTDWDFTTIWEIIPGYYPRLRAIPDAALPVELTSFTANYVDGKVLLNWQTATEVNSYGFDVERASTSLGMTWEKIGFVQGHGNSNSPKSYSFTDNLALAHDLNLDRISYRLKQIDFDGKYEYSNVVEVKIETAAQFMLAQNYPNPFNPETTINYQLPQASHVTLKIYNILGKEVAKLVDEQKTAGTHYCKLSTANYQLSSGVYFYTLKTDNGFAATKKLLFIK